MITADSVETRDYDLAGLRFALSRVGGKLRTQVLTTADARRMPMSREARSLERVPVLVLPRIASFHVRRCERRAIARRGVIVLPLRRMVGRAPPGFIEIRRGTP
jgi:hypothetical protein